MLQVRLPSPDYQTLDSKHSSGVRQIRLLWEGTHDRASRSLAIVNGKKEISSFKGELPLAYLQGHPQVHCIARTPGFFALGFSPSLFYKLTALEQRLAIFLARRVS